MSGAGLFSAQSMRKALPVIKLGINEITRTPLVDLSFSQSLTNGSICRQWNGQKMAVLTANRKVLRSRFGSIKLGVNNGDPVTDSVLVVDSTLLGFDLLLEIDVIKELGVVRITESGEVHFSSSPICAALRIDGAGFSA